MADIVGFRSFLAGLGLIALGIIPAWAGASFVTLPGDRAYPESVTSTPDGTVYAGSFASGGIFRAPPGAAKAEVWIKPGAFGTRSTLGVLADEKSGTLWVCSNDLSARGVPGPTRIKGTWLKGFDLKTGAGKVSARFPGTHNFCNDIAVDARDAVYVTNSLQPEILKLNRAKQTLEVWLRDARFAPPATGSGLDGITFGADGDLYVDKFVEAKLFRVDVKDGKPGAITELQPSQPLELTDALRPLGGDAFLLIEGAGRLDRMIVNGNEATIETLKSGLNGPTGVTHLGDKAWVSEGQLARLFAKENPQPVLPFHLSAVTIPAP